MNRLFACLVAMMAIPLSADAVTPFSIENVEPLTTSFCGPSLVPALVPLYLSAIWLIAMWVMLFRRSLWASTRQGKAAVISIVLSVVNVVLAYALYAGVENQLYHSWPLQPLRGLQLIFEIFVQPAYALGCLADSIQIVPPLLSALVLYGSMVVAVILILMSNRRVDLSDRTKLARLARIRTLIPIVVLIVSIVLIFMVSRPGSWIIDRINGS